MEENINEIETVNQINQILSEEKELTKFQGPLRF